jgi:acetyl esterase/lipase
VKRVFLWIAGIVVALAVVVVLAFRLSPWPSVAVIEYLFSKGDAASEARLLKHVPPDIAARLNLRYGPGPDERMDVFRQENATSVQPGLVWVHGGGWIAGSKEGVSNYLKVLAGHGYTAVAIEYSTGYRGTYPKPVEQVNAALGYVVAHAAELGIDPAGIILAGDSAGAQLAAQVSLLTTGPAYAAEVRIPPALEAGQIAGVVLVSGAYDLEGIDLNGKFGWFLEAVLWAYSGVRDFMNDPRFKLASVTEHVTAAFPPAFISSGNSDPLAPQAVQFSEALAKLAVPTETLFFPDDYSPALPHEYQFNLDEPAGAEALERILAFLAERTAARAESAR